MLIFTFGQNLTLNLLLNLAMTAGVRADAPAQVGDAGGALQERHDAAPGAEGLVPDAAHRRVRPAPRTRPGAAGTELAVRWPRR